MPIFQLDERIAFPSPVLADPDGLLAIGGDLRPERLLLAYATGIFPWPARGYPLLWHSPDPRYVLPLDLLHVPRSLRRTLHKRTFEVTLDANFSAVIRACAKVPRPGQEGTWITREMIAAYERLHELGFAHSVEVRRDGDQQPCGGLYGVSLGGAFFGESMFARAPDASKVGFVLLCEQLARWGLCLVDAQVHTEHLERFGAVTWPRERYLAELALLMRQPTRKGPWRLGCDAP